MATKKDDPVVEPVETPAPVVTRSRRGLTLAAIIVGGVVAAGLLFGGGVLVGTHLPGGGDRPGFSQAELSGGAMPQGERPNGAPQGGPQQGGGLQQQGGGQPPQQQQDDDDN